MPHVKKNTGKGIAVSCFETDVFVLECYSFKFGMFFTTVTQTVNSSSYKDRKSESTDLTLKKKNLRLEWAKEIANLCMSIKGLSQNV